MRLNFACFLPALFAFTTVQAATSELQVRTGPIVAQYSGPVSGDLAIPTSIDIDYGFFVANNKSVNFRFIFATEFPDVRGDYIFAGVGQRHFFRSKGVPFEGEVDGIRMRIESKWRYYTGYDVGISQMIVQSFGRAVQISSTLLDVSANLGTIYQLDSRFGLTAQVGLGMGYGFSSVAVVSINGRLTAGFSYFF